MVDLLTSLVEKSLVALDDQRPDGQARYTLLETVRQYAAERLRAAGEDGLVRARHRDWCLAFAEAAARQMWVADQERWLDRLETERDNLRAALDWSWSEPGAVEAAGRLVAALWWFWHVRGHPTEGLRQIERALAADAGVSPRTRAGVLNGAGFLAYYSGGFQRAVPLLEEALALAQAVGDGWNAAYALGSLGLVTPHLHGDPARARALLQEGLDLARANGDRFNVVRLVNNLGVVAMIQGEHELAWSLFQESLAGYRALGSTSMVAMSLTLLGRVAFFRGDAERAGPLLEESVAMSRAAGFTQNLGLALTGLARLTRTRGEPERATALFQESLTHRRAIGDMHGVAECLDGLAGIARVQGKPARATRLFGAAEALREAIGVRVSPSNRALSEPDLLAVRAALGQQAFAAAWAEGQALSLEAAIEEALAPPEPVAADATPRAARPEAAAGPLTPREREVAALVVRGLTNRRIGEALVITRRTAEVHVARILRKLGLGSRAELAAWAVEHGLRDAEPG